MNFDAEYIEVHFVAKIPDYVSSIAYKTYQIIIDNPCSIDMTGIDAAMSAWKSDYFAAHGSITQGSTTVIIPEFDLLRESPYLTRKNLENCVTDLGMLDMTATGYFGELMLVDVIDTATQETLDLTSSGVSHEWISLYTNTVPQSSYFPLWVRIEGTASEPT